MCGVLVGFGASCMERYWQTTPILQLASRYDRKKITLKSHAICLVINLQLELVATYYSLISNVCENH